MTEFATPRVQLVIRDRAHRVWACGGYRAERTAVSKRDTRWRVWAVIGGTTLAGGIVKGRTDADRRAVQALRVIAHNSALAAARRGAPI